ncbi:hypothetical protein A374_15404 [Fictibacillus macauensis ZFHKF-1]|uniref:DUF5068 domain-containing protein n=1 Tax=Fictibacillus macauensis ZFHKF-1 TaxID=1196324 RepID=I8AG98_9BACL|nr:DUF5068 domain-containing protein [Fictibacillus macauensis]EIT84434.1 hypothetical protein A374_15404 [Fictibacillus macauensis ZFHKF-1]
MGRHKMLAVGILSGALLLSACNNQEVVSSKKKASAEKKESNGLLNSKLEKKSGGKAEIIYTNKEPNLVNDMEGFKTSVDEYQVARVTDASTEEADYRFKQQKKGYVVMMKLTYENTSDKTLYHNINDVGIYDKDPSYERSPDGTFQDASDSMHGDRKDNKHKFDAHEKVTGIATLALTDSEYKQMESLNAKIKLGGGAKETEDFGGKTYGDDKVANFILNEEQGKKVAEQNKFYPDKLLTDNLVTKKMVKEIKDIKETNEFKGIKTTIEGAQYTEITPTPENKRRFGSMADGKMIALTLKVKTENGTKNAIEESSSTLHIDGDRSYMLNQNMVQPKFNIVKPHGQNENLIVFIFRKDEFSIYKKFDIIMKYYDHNSKDMFQEKEAPRIKVPK